MTHGRILLGEGIRRTLETRWGEGQTPLTQRRGFGVVPGFLFMQWTVNGTCVSSQSIPGVPHGRSWDSRWSSPLRKGSPLVISSVPNRLLPFQPPATVPFHTHPVRPVSMYTRLPLGLLLSRRVQSFPRTRVHARGPSPFSGCRCPLLSRPDSRHPYGRE